MLLICRSYKKTRFELNAIWTKPKYKGISNVFRIGPRICNGIVFHDSERLMRFFIQLSLWAQLRNYRHVRWGACSSELATFRIPPEISYIVFWMLVFDHNNSNHCQAKTDVVGQLFPVFIEQETLFTCAVIQVLLDCNRKLRRIKHHRFVRGMLGVDLIWEFVRFLELLLFGFCKCPLWYTI